MHVAAHELVVATAGRGFVDVTAAVNALVVNVDVGVATVFVHHTSASLLIQENADPAVRVDLEAFFARLVKDGDPLFTHTDEGPDDMSAHVRATLTATSLAIPVRRGRLDLGRWQALYLFEHRTRPHERRISVTVVGSARTDR